MSDIQRTESLLFLVDFAYVLVAAVVFTFRLGPARVRNAWLGVGLLLGFVTVVVVFTDYEIRALEKE